MIWSPRTEEVESFIPVSGESTSRTFGGSVGTKGSIECTLGSRLRQSGWRRYVGFGLGKSTRGEECERGDVTGDLYRQTARPGEGEVGR